jgi:hypothetical protein
VRRCGFGGRGPGTGGRGPVWARGGVSLDECPKSYVSAESQLLVEEYWVRKRIGGGLRVEDLSARQVEAFVILEKALAEEKRNGQRHGRRTG